MRYGFRVISHTARLAAVSSDPVAGMETPPLKNSHRARSTLLDHPPNEHSPSNPAGCGDFFAEALKTHKALTYRHVM